MTAESLKEFGGDVLARDVPGTDDMPAPPPMASSPSTVAEGLASSLRDLGVVHALGVCGGAQALLWAAFSKHLDVLHFRHESGAAFAATEAHFASNRPVVVFTTTGPGITNVLTGTLAARTEGAKLILVSAYASAPQRGRGGIQETSSYTMPASGIFEAGAWFDDAVILETPEQLPQVLRRLAAGLQRPGAYVAHISIPNAVQGAMLPRPLPKLHTQTAPSAPGASTRPGVNRAAVAHCAKLLAAEPFAIWAGFGARDAAPAIRALAERAGAPVMCSPRAKGVFPEDHPLFVGVTGMGGTPPRLSPTCGTMRRAGCWCWGHGSASRPRSGTRAWCQRAASSTSISTPLCPASPIRTSRPMACRPMSAISCPNCSPPGRSRLRRQPRHRCRARTPAIRRRAARAGCARTR